MTSYNDEPPPSYDSVCNNNIKNTETKRVSNTYEFKCNYPFAQHNCIQNTYQQHTYPQHNCIQHTYPQHTYPQHNCIQHTYPQHTYPQHNISCGTKNYTTVIHNNCLSVIQNYNNHNSQCNYIQPISKSTVIQTNITTQNQKPRASVVSYRTDKYGVRIPNIAII